MKTEELNFILQEGEGFKIEFKEYISGIDKDMVAFANAEGGRIFIGIDDSKKVKAVKLTNKLRVQISDIARNCDPHIKINLTHSEGVIIINVPTSDNKPHKCSSGFYLRKDAASCKMGRDELIDFIHSQDKKQFDSLPCRQFKLRDLDKLLLEEYLKKAGINIRTTLKETLFNLGVYNDSKVNNAGVLFFSKSPKRYFINAYVTCARYLGTDKVEILDRADFSGNIVSQIDESVQFVRRNTRLAYEIKDIRRKEIPEYPVEAVRESVINAVMHRDYFEAGAHAQVDIFDNRIEISNVGSLIKPITKKSLEKFAVRRNPLIADLLHRIKYVEKMGTGLRRIKNSCKERGIKVNIEINGYFIIQFKRVPANVPANKRQRWVLDYFSKYKKITTREFQNNFTSITLKTIKRDLAYLRKNKMIKFSGATKTGHYELVNDKRK